MKKAATSEGVPPSHDWRRDTSKLQSYAPYDATATPSPQVIQKECFELWFNNPLAQRIIEILVDFVFGDGFELSVENEAVQDYIDKWASDPTVQLYSISEEWLHDLLILGEFALQPEVNEINGFVRLNPIDLSKINQVFTRFGMPILINVGGLKNLEVVYLDNDPRSPDRGYLVGDVLFAQINKTTQLSRGYSVLLTLRDWLKGYDDFLFNELSRAIALRKFLIHLKIKGASAEDIKKYKAMYSAPPESGTLIISNENEEWDFKSPDLNTGNTDILGKTIRNMILAGGGIAEHWLAEGGDVNRATAAEMAKPILRRLKRFQGIFVRFVEQVVNFAANQAIKAGAIPGVSTESEGIYIEVVADPIIDSDEASEWSLFNQMIQALTLAASGGYINPDEARKIVVKFMNQIGAEVAEEAEGGGSELQKSINKELEVKVYKSYQDKLKEGFSNAYKEKRRSNK